jgi:hypothetical protein
MNGGSKLGWVARSALGVVAIFASGCAGQTVEAAFASDFHCNSEITVEESEALGRFNAHGCGREAVYQCVSVTSYNVVCDLQATNQSERSYDRDDTAAAPSRERTVSVSKVQSQNEEKSRLSLELKLSNSAMLRLSAAPDKAEELVQLKLIQRSRQEGVDSCQLELMINGQVLKMPPTVTKNDARLLSHRVQVGPDVMTELAVAEKVALRLCKGRFSLTGEQVQQVRELMERYREEKAWTMTPREGGSGGRVAPTGGWPNWAPEGTPPSAVKSEELEGTALFKQLSSSVFKLEATLTGGVSQGSAVAVSEKQLLTNCHVIEGALKLVLKQDKQQWPARVVRSDPKSDRCVIESDHPQLTPVAGVRSYDSLEVGEKAYTLGSPSGLELTLSDGIVSGRREEGDFRLVQTTAPISPGSSGGGLFDARGNLIGITTLVLVGRQRLNQSLNFAIPADTFWQK